MIVGDDGVGMLVVSVSSDSSGVPPTRDDSDSEARKYSSLKMLLASRS